MVKQSCSTAGNQQTIQKAEISPWKFACRRYGEVVDEVLPWTKN
jgi:hypothetical protein